MKKLSAIVVLLGLWSVQWYAFNDIQYNWYKDSIEGLERQEYINGFESWDFLPHDKTTRAEILKIIMNASESEIYETGTQCFSDVATYIWYNKYICAGVEQEITKWYDDGNFKPNGNVTVLETLAFAVRAFDIDLSYLGEWETWFQKYQAYADQKNIIKKHAYTIDTLVSRGQAADIIYKMQKVSSGQELSQKSDGCFNFQSMQSGEYSIDMNGLKREYLLYVPDNLNAETEKWLIVAFHGRTNSNEEVRNYMKMGWGGYSRSGYQQDYIVAYPAGVGNGPFSWSEIESIEFFDAIISDISKNLCINRDKVFSVWHSLGSYMSNKTSCLRWDVIRAMVWVASNGYNWDCTGPVSSLITHLPNDPLSPYSAWERAYSLKSENNLCQTETSSIELWDLRWCQQKTSCSLWNTVIFCNSYDVYGWDQHSWPKSGADEMRDFFTKIDEYAK